MRSLKLFLIGILMLGASALQAQTTDVFSTPGTYTWVVPPCVTSITVDVWAGGAGGGAVWSRYSALANGADCESGDEICAGAGGGGGGGYVRRTYAVTPGQTYTIVVGAGGAGGAVIGGDPYVSPTNGPAKNGSNGGNSTFSGPATVGPGTLTAIGGTGGQCANVQRSCLGGCSFNHTGEFGTGGSGGSGLNGTTTFTGGSGAAGSHSASTNDKSGGGGGGAGTTANGGNAATTTGGTGGALSGGNGADGIVQPFGTNYQGTAGLPGNTLAGGGSGASSHHETSCSSTTGQGRVGGNGARGEVRITFTAPAPTTPTFNPVSPICDGDPLAPLPTTSTNGVTGTWSPALDNTTTTIYTFTPTAGLCASTTTMTITVNPVPTISAQPQNIPICATGSATMSATATGGVYQWQYFDGSTWSNVVSGTPAGYTYANATTTSLGITTSNAANTASCSDAQFRLLVGSAPCQIISNSATVTVVRATRIAPTGPQCSGTQLNFDACPAGATYSWSVTPPVGASATPTTGNAQTFSFTPTNTTAINQVFTVNSSVTYSGLTCPQTFSPTISPAPNAGANGTVSVCETGSAINLYTSLGGTPAATGTWSGGLTGGNLGTYDPALLAPGTYTYTVSSPGCPDATATVAVTETPGPVAGNNGTASVCATGSPINLFSSLGGTPAATGSWSGGLTGGNLGTYDPTTMTPVTFTYTVTAAGCADATATVAVTETPGANAGNNGTASICATGSPVNLFSSLGGTPAATGSWSGVLTGGNLGTYDPTSMSPGTFTYTVSLVGCADASATVAVTETPAPVAGSNGTTSVCATGTPINLFSSLGGTPAATGSWSGGLTGGNLGTYDPATLTPGTYTYTVSSAGCADATATVAVTESPAPNAGNNGSVSVCESGTPVDLFSSLGGTPAATGSWSGGLTGGNLGTYDPNTMTPGTFTYTVSAIGCADATSTVSITETTGPNAGSNGAISVCENGSPIDLYSSLGGTPDATGTWSGGLTGGNLGTYDPLIFSQGTFTYTVSLAGCADATASIIVTEVVAPNAGTDGALTLCSGTVPSNAQLLAALGGTPDAGGIWTNVGLVYTYTVSPTSPCSTPATANVTVTETAIPSAPSAYSDTTYCSGDVLVDLNVVGGTGTFTWYSDNALTNVIGTGLTLTPDNTLGTTVYYVTESNLGCQGPADSVFITINVCTLPDVEIAVPTAFTPNGDGTHDTWELVNLDAKYPKNKVYIYNRWGNLIFESKEGAYDAAPWDGSFNDKPMPVGSYYYMIYPDEKGSDEIIKGIVSIIKK